MNPIDARILERLQRDSAQSIAVLADAVGLSPSACHRRIKALEASGAISGYAARIEPEQLGLKLHAFVEITLNSQSSEAMERFEEAVKRFIDILECRLMTGQADYLLRVSARDLDHFDELHRTCLARLPGVSSMRSSFVIRTIKSWAGYPTRKPAAAHHQAAPPFP